MFAQLNQTLARTVVGFVGTALCAGLSLSGAMAPAHAATVDARSEVVRYADLNLSNPEGRATFDRRVRNAARAVCTTGGKTLQLRTAEARCIRDAVNSALPQIVAAFDARAAG